MVERRVLRLRACRPDHLEACKQGRWGALEGGVQDRARLAWLWPPCPYDRDNPNSVLVRPARSSEYCSLRWMSHKPKRNPIYTLGRGRRTWPTSYGPKWRRHRRRWVRTRQHQILKTMGKRTRPLVAKEKAALLTTYLPPGK